MPHDIFISYSRKNLDAIKSIKEELESFGFSCWMDLEGIESGSEEFSDHLTNAIKETKVFLFFLSASSQKSKWARKELRFAKVQDKRVVIVRFNDCVLTDTFDFDYGGDDIIDWRKQAQKDKLLRDLHGWTAKGKMRESKCSGESSTSGPAKKKSTHKKRRIFPISINFEYIELPVLPPLLGFPTPKMRFYQLNIENHKREPLDVTISVSNGGKRKEYRQIISGNSIERFRTLGGVWRFTHGDRGTIKVVGWSNPLKFGLDADGYWPSRESLV